MTSFQPAWWLPGPNAVTLWGKFGRKEAPADICWERLATPDGDFVELAHLRKSGQSNTDFDPASTTPRLILMHGLEGGVQSHYVRGFMREARIRDWNATLLLFRTCGPTPNALPRSYHSGETSDIRFVLNTLANRQPLAPMGVAAVSLGGNVLCKTLGEPGEALPVQLRGAAALSVPFDLARASRHIGRGFARLYQWSFLRSLVTKAIQKIARHPELAQLHAVQHCRTIWEFDDVFTSALHGFADAADYYAQSSSLQFLSGIRVPTLLLSAVDDPFLPAAVLDDVRAVAAHNPALEMEFTKRGGHVGFVGGRSPFNPFYYGEWRAAEFLSKQFAAATHTVTDRRATDRERTPHSARAIA